MFRKKSKKHLPQRDEEDVELENIAPYAFSNVKENEGDLEPLLVNEISNNHTYGIGPTTAKLEMPPPLLPERLEVISIRCSRCNLYYTPKDHQHCHYHPGHFKLSYNSPSVGGVSLVYWSCCKSTVRNQKGCKIGTHQPDPSMNNVGIHIITDPQPHNTTPPPQTVPSSPSPRESPTPQDAQPSADPNFIRHKVMDTDTLVGLSFRYKIPVKTIRQFNRMPTSDLKAYAFLNIPTSPTATPPDPVDHGAVERNRLHRKLREETGMSKEETTYYLSLHGYSYEQALNEFKMDKAWEKNGISKQPFNSKKVK